jgi:hypothetical protein
MAFSTGYGTSPCCAPLLYPAYPFVQHSLAIFRYRCFFDMAGQTPCNIHFSATVIFFRSYCSKYCVLHHFAMTFELAVQHNHNRWSKRMAYDPDYDLDDLPDEDDDLLWNPDKKRRQNRHWDEDEDEWGDGWDSD